MYINVNYMVNINLVPVVKKPKPKKLNAINYAL